MTPQAALPVRTLARRQWPTLGATAAIAAIVAVLICQVIALTIWPDLAAFKPLDSLTRTAIFTLIPAVMATALFAWLTNHRTHPDQSFLRIAFVILLISIIPDYLLPDAGKTFLASSVTAFLHLVAAAVIASVLVIGYRRNLQA